jgi:superfamily II DNA helicase RecQ
LLIKTKSDISEEFSKPDSKLRLIFATDAYGMGVDVADIKRIVHVGTPTNLESKFNKAFM